jgi:DNA polymerase III delta prime subunit
MDVNQDQFLFTEKYRPKKVEDCVLPEMTKNLAQTLVEKGEITNLLFSGGPGVGKTSLAKAICEELGCDYLYVNCSIDNGIDTLRTKISGFASSMSLQGGVKVVIMDEADRISGAAQDALKAEIEAFAKNTRFIFTTNHKNKIIDPIRSRCNDIDFKLTAEDKPKMGKLIFRRLKEILNNENIEYEDSLLVEVIKRYFPDYRRILNEIQRYSISGKLEIGILGRSQDEQLEGLIESLKAKDFKAMREWVANNMDDVQGIYLGLFKTMNTWCKPKSIPDLVLILADYQFKSSQVVCQEINLTACALEIMSSCEFN